MDRCLMYANDGRVSERARVARRVNRGRTQPCCMPSDKTKAQKFSSNDRSSTTTLRSTGESRTQMEGPAYGENMTNQRYSAVRRIRRARQPARAETSRRGRTQKRSRRHSPHAPRLQQATHEKLDEVALLLPLEIRHQAGVHKHQVGWSLTILHRRRRVRYMTCRGRR